MILALAFAAVGLLSYLFGRWDAGRHWHEEVLHARGDQQRWRSRYEALERRIVGGHDA